MFTQAVKARRGGIEVRVALALRTNIDNFSIFVKQIMKTEEVLAPTPPNILKNYPKTSYSLKNES